MCAAAVELAEGMTQECQTDPLLTPGTPHGQRTHPALAIFIHTEGDTGNFVALDCQEPERWIESFAINRPVFPMFKGVGQVAPVIPECFIVGVKHSMFV